MRLSQHELLAAMSRAAPLLRAGARHVQIPLSMGFDETRFLRLSWSADGICLQDCWTMSQVYRTDSLVTGVPGVLGIRYVFCPEATGGYGHIIGHSEHFSGTLDDNALIVLFSGLLRHGPGSLQAMGAPGHLANPGSTLPWDFVPEDYGLPDVSGRWNPGLPGPGRQQSHHRLMELHFRAADPGTTRTAHPPLDRLLRAIRRDLVTKTW